MNKSLPEKGSSIKEIYPSACNIALQRPFFLSGVSAGFPTPADDYLDLKLDLNEHLVKNPAATFFVRVAGDSMTGAGAATPSNPVVSDLPRSGITGN